VTATYHSHAKAIPDDDDNAATFSDYIKTLPEHIQWLLMHIEFVPGGERMLKHCLENERIMKIGDKICMMTTRLACNRAIESSYWRMDNDPDVGLLTGYVLYQLPVELEFMDLDTFPC
jgi:hypothetical protein